MDRRALITGITGQDGSYLAELLLSKGYEVFGLIRRLSSPNTKNILPIMEKVTLLDGDLTDQTSLMTAIKEAEPDEVYNLAAQSFVATSFRQPVLTADVNGLGVVRLLEAARETAPETRIYQASTSEMFGNAPETPQRETTPFHPRSPYGLSKVFGYWASVNFRESYGMHVSNGIMFNHESPRRGMEFVTRKIAHGVAMISRKKGKHIVLGNLDAKRDWGYAPEYVVAMWKMLQQREPDDFVVATGETHSVGEFLQLAFEEVGIKDWKSRVRTEERYFRPADVGHLCGDASKAQRRLGWKPKTKFHELVRIMVRAELDQVNA